MYKVVAPYTSPAIFNAADVEIELTGSVANDRVFADETTVAPAIDDQPTVVEMTAFALAGNHTDTIIYFTGTDTATDPILRVYHVDNSGVVTEMKIPLGGWNLAFVPATLTANNNYILIAAGTFELPL